MKPYSGQIFFAISLQAFRDVVGGRSGGYQKVFRDGREAAIEDLKEEARALGADAVIAIDIDYETVGQSMLMVSANGTAVKLG